MSATELFEQIRSLPPREQATFAVLFEHWKSAGYGAIPSTLKQPELPDYAARLRQLFPDGPINGDPQNFWDELRAERF